LSTDTTISYCCKDFKDMLDEGLIELDGGQGRSHGWYTREKYVIHVHDQLQLTADIYMKYCPRCGAVLTTTS